MCQIGSYYLNHGNSAFFLRIFLHYIKIHRLGVKHIAVRGLYFHKGIAFSVFQSLRGDQLAIYGRIESINGCHFWISESHCHKVAVRVVNLEACPCIRDGFPCFRIFLHNLDIAFKVGIVDKIAVGLTVGTDKHIKRLHQLTPFPSRSLFYRINAIRHIFCLGKTVLITDELVTLAFFCLLKAACRFKEYLKDSTFFWSFDACFAVIGMLDNSDISLDNLLIHIIFDRIIFHLIKFWLCTDFMNSRVKKIPLGRTDFSDCPVIAAHIILGRKLTVFVGGVGVNQFFALVNAINRTCQRCVPLRCSCFCIGLSYRHIEFLENILETAVCNLIPFNRCGLGCRNNIADCCIHFLKHIRGVAADQDILKLGYTFSIGDSILIDCKSAKRCAVQMEFHALHQIVLGSLDYFKAATL